MHREKNTTSCHFLNNNAALAISKAESAHLLPRIATALNGASLDVHLGNWFGIVKRVKLRTVEIGRRADERLLRTIGREEAFVPPGKSFLIHPGDLLLGITREFFCVAK